LPDFMRLANSVETSAYLHTSIINQKSAVARPVTVQHNLKFKQHDDLEKSFLHFYPDLIHILSQDIAGKSPSLANDVTKLLTSNLSTQVIGKRYGLLVPRSYKELGGDKEEEAIVLGWGVELMRAANNLTAEIVHDLEINRRGQLTWHRKNNLGQEAISHVKILESSIFTLLRKYFDHTTQFSSFLECFVTSLRHQALSYSLDLKLNNKNTKPKLADYDMSRFKSLVYSTKTYPILVLPVSLALYLADLNKVSIHEQTKQILTEIGLLHQVRQDFENCFKHAEEGDIARGRVTWLIVLARQRASRIQLNELEAIYGDAEPEHIARVKEIYYDLKLHKNIPMYINSKMVEIERYIQQMAKVDKEGLSQALFFKILGDISSDDFTFIQSPGHYQQQTLYSS